MTRPRMPDWTRRATLGGLAAGVGAGLAGFGPGSADAEAPPETTKVRILTDPVSFVLCWAPQYLAVDFLRMEGFTEIETLPWDTGKSEAAMLDEGWVDFTAIVATDMISGIDRGRDIVGLAGLHAGCIEMFANDRVASITDMRGARLLSSFPGGMEEIFFSALLAYVGLDPRRDVAWVYEHDYRKWPDLFAADKVDVVNAFTSLNYAFHEQGLGHVILNTTTDDPWRHFFCCMLAGNGRYVRENPVATRRVLRAIARAQHLCVDDPDEAIRRLIAMGATPREDFARRALADIDYASWRTYDPAASVRFFALRLGQAGMIAAAPNQILERGTDFSFVTALASETKT